MAEVKKPADHRQKASAKAEVDLSEWQAVEIEFDGEVYVADLSLAMDSIDLLEGLAAIQSGDVMRASLAALSLLRVCLGDDGYARFKADQTRVNGRCSLTKTNEFINQMMELLPGN